MRAHRDLLSRCVRTIDTPAVGALARSVSAFVIAGAALAGAASEVEAGDWKKSRGYHAPGYVFVPPGHVRYYAPAPIVYAPAPVVVYPAPVMYAPVYPAYAPYAAPVGSISLGINLPLR